MRRTVDGYKQIFNKLMLGMYRVPEMSERCDIFYEL